MIMSDHGFSPCRKIFFMDKWLHQHGYLSYLRKSSNRYALTKFLHLAFQRNVPNRFKSRLTSLLPGLRDQLRSYLTTATIDWSRTKAFSLGIDSTNIFVNLKERFPQGTVGAGPEYEDLRDEITDRLYHVVDPETGENIVQKVYRREELYCGDCLNKAPDLLVTWKDYEYNTRRGYDNEGNGLLGSSLDFSDVSAYSSLQKSGTHHLKGIFITNGPRIRKRASVKGARIIDLAPTILYLLGESIPADMDGRTIEDIIQADFASVHPIRFGSLDFDKTTVMSGYSEVEEKHIRDKLQGLGYID